MLKFNFKNSKKLFTRFMRETSAYCVLLKIPIKFKIALAYHAPTDLPGRGGSVPRVVPLGFHLRGKTFGGHVGAQVVPEHRWQCV